jgi:hypothetical protein
MGWIDSGSTYGEVVVDLVDGYLPRKDKLLKLAEQASTLTLQGDINPDAWSPDRICQELAHKIRESFCIPQKSTSIRNGRYCEAWLLNPEKGFGSEFELKNEKVNTQNRRLLVTLHYDCKAGKLCLQNLLNRTNFEVIPEDRYKDYAAFEKAASKLFEVAAEPFLAPCIIAEHEMEKCGYRCAGFGR